MSATNKFGLTYLRDERIIVDDKIDEKYPWKVCDVYEEDGVGKVCYYVLQDTTPKKTVARHIFNDNPKIQKVYMALRDWVCYNLIEDLNKGRKVKVFDRASFDSNDEN